MFDYTEAAIRGTVRDIKKISAAFTVSSQILYIAYIIYALIVGGGFLAANIALLTFSVLYLGFYIFTYDRKGAKKIKKLTKRVYKWILIAVKAITLGSTVYGIYIATERVEVMTVVLAGLTTVGWTLNVVMTVLVAFVEGRVEIFVTALKADSDPVIRQVDKVKANLRAMAGEAREEKEKEEDNRVTKIRMKLDEEVSALRSEKQEKKKIKKEERKEFAKAVFNNLKNKGKAAFSRKGETEEKAEDKTEEKV